MKREIIWSGGENGWRGWKACKGDAATEMDQGANNKRWGFVTEENKLELSAVQNLPSFESKCFANNSLIKFYCRSHE